MFKKTDLNKSDSKTKKTTLEDLVKASIFFDNGFFPIGIIPEDKTKPAKEVAPLPSSQTSCKL